MLKIFQNLQIEEWVLFFTSLIVFFWLIFLNPSYLFDFKSLWQKSFIALNLAISWWYQGGIFFFLLYFFLRIGIFLFVKFSSSKNKGKKKKTNFSKEDWRGFIIFLKTVFLIIISFSLSAMLNGVLSMATKNRLINENILEWEKKIFGDSPVFWLNARNNPYRNFLKVLAPLAINCFFSLSFLMSFSFFCFYLDKKNYFFKILVIASFLLLLLSFPLWYFFPAHSPLNAFIFQKEIKDENYQPFEKIKNFQEKLWQEQKESPPVSTFPSMHWGWGVILVYCFFRKKSGTLFLTFPWFFLMALGSLFLGCHYLIDGILGIFLAFISIILAELLIFWERKKVKKISEKEEIFKEKLKEFLLEPFRELLEFLGKSV